MEQNLYGYALITCIRDIRLPLYERTLHYQGKAGDTYKIECYNEAEADFYRSLSRPLEDSIFFGGIVTPIDLEYRQTVGGGYFSSIYSGVSPENEKVPAGYSGRLCQEIDGKSITGGLPVRNIYDGGTF